MKIHKFPSSAYNQSFIELAHSRRTNEPDPDADGNNEYPDHQTEL